MNGPPTWVFPALALMQAVLTALVLVMVWGVRRAYHAGSELQRIHDRLDFAGKLQSDLATQLQVLIGRIPKDFDFMPHVESEKNWERNWCDHAVTNTRLRDLELILARVKGGWADAKWPGGAEPGKDR